MKLKYIFLSVFAITLFAQCKHTISGKGEVITETRSADPFHNVKLEGTGNIAVTHGTTTIVSVKSYENIVPLIKTTVRDGELLISMDHHIMLSGSNNIEIDITTPDLNEVSMNGAGNVQITSFHTPKIKLDLSGAGNIRFYDSECDSVYARLSGAGNMYVNASRYLDATVNGVGNIEYSGDPQVHSQVNGVGSVKKGK